MSKSLYLARFSRYKDFCVCIFEKNSKIQNGRHYWQMKYLLKLGKASLHIYPVGQNFAEIPLVNFYFMKKMVPKSTHISVLFYMCVPYEPTFPILCFAFFVNFIYLFGVLRRFQHCTGHITTGSWKGRGNQYIQFVRVLYCKLPTNGKQLPAFPLEAMPGTEPRPQRWEARCIFCQKFEN